MAMTWNSRLDRGVANYFDGDGWYFSSQILSKNPAHFTQLNLLATILKSQKQIMVLAPLSGI